MNSWLAENLVCPRDHEVLAHEGNVLSCPSGHSYPIIDDVPIMLVEEARATHWVVDRSLEANAGPEGADPYYIESLGMQPEKRERLKAELASYDPESGAIDPVVNWIIQGTSGNLYKPLLGKLESYPIPEIRLPPSDGELLLDVGCNWGRWSIAAARKGYRVIGLDPSLGAVLAARRVAAQLGVSPTFIVGDAQFLPFRADQFDIVYSYGVLQHFSKQSVRNALEEFSRVLKPGARSLVQMASLLGVRSIQTQFKRRFRKPTGFQARYWTPWELLRTFSDLIGETQLSADCYFGLGIQPSDVAMLRPHHRLVVHSSEALRRVSDVVSPLRYVADSVYLSSSSHV